MKTYHRKAVPCGILTLSASSTTAVVVAKLGGLDTQRQCATTFFFFFRRDAFDKKVIRDQMFTFPNKTIFVLRYGYDNRPISSPMK